MSLIAGMLVLTMGGSAQSYWTATGRGSASATTGTTVAVPISPGTPTPTLHPGGLADVVLAISNPNTVAISIASLVLDASRGTSGFAVDSAHSGCVLSTLSFTTQSNAGAGWSVPAHSGSVDGILAVTLVGALAMDVDAGNACQGAVFTVYLTAGS